nr:hypothetical protein [Tanacetum cinerariifolium]
MAPKKRTTRSSPATTTTTTTPMTDAQLKTLIAQGVADVLTERDATRRKNGEDNHDSGMGVRRQAPLARECTYLDFIKCKPLYFKGIERVFELTQWTVGHDIAYAITWINLKKMMTDKYCLRSEIKKLEELALMSVRMFPEESDKIKKYVGGLSDMIHGSISTLVERQAENKRKFDNNNQAQQQPSKKQGVAIAYIAGPGERKEYSGTLLSPAATNNQRNPTCYECGNQGHYRSDCLELKNQNHRNQAGDTRARGMVHALGAGETNQDLNNIEDDINA